MGFSPWTTKNINPAVKFVAQQSTKTMRAKSITANSVEAIQSSLQEAMTDAFSPTLAIVFTSLKDEWQQVQSLLNNQGIAIFGATTAVEFTEAGIGEAGITILLLDMDPAYFKLILNDSSQSSSYEAASAMAASAVASFTHPAFILLTTHSKTPGDEVIKGITEKAGEEVRIIGGIAGDLINLEGTVFTNNESSNHGILCLVIDEDKIDVTGIAVSGWKPLGTFKTITESEGVWVHTIDGSPAMDVVEKYVGDVRFDETDTNNIVKLTTTYPLQVTRNGSSPAMIPTLFLNKKTRAVMCSQSLAPGTTFRFSLPPDFDVIETVIESSRSVKENQLPDVDALIVFSCVGRHETLGPMMSEEIEGLASTWNEPMAGFFSMGEFGTVAGGKPEFHGTTCSWVALKEK